MVELGDTVGKNVRPVATAVKPEANHQRCVVGSCLQPFLSKNLYLYG